MNLKLRFLLSALVTLCVFPAFAHTVPNSPAGVKPSKDFCGRYPALIKSMNNGQVHSIRPDNVRSYGHAHLGHINNSAYWMVPVEFSRRAPDGLGLILADAYACVRNGRVEFWVYKHSNILVR